MAFFFFLFSGDFAKSWTNSRAAWLGLWRLLRCHSDQEQTTAQIVFCQGGRLRPKWPLSSGSHGSEQQRSWKDWTSQVVLVLSATQTRLSPGHQQRSWGFQWQKVTALAPGEALLPLWVCAATRASAKVSEGKLERASPEPGDEDKH